MTKRHIPQMAIDLIKHFEGFSPVVYICSSGFKTVGYGHALRKEEDSLFEKGITEEEAIILLQKDIEWAANAVTRLTKVELSESEFAALISFVFNIGSAGYQRSTLRSMLNRGEYLEASLQFDRWAWGGGRKLPGLIRRRKVERVLFQTGVLVI